MLDFSKKQRRYWPVILEDGTKLEIPVPKLELYSRLEGMSGEKTNTAETIDIVLEIFNTNRQNIVFERHEVAEAFDSDDLMKIIAGYSLFIAEALNDPNLKSLIAQQKAMKAVGE